MKADLRTIKTIGIVSPSSPVKRDWLSSAITLLSQRGYAVKLGRSVFARDAYRAGRIDVRARDILEMFEDRAVDLVLASTGGYNANALLEYLPIKRLARKQKWFVGFSDVTVLTTALYAAGSSRSVYGPNATYCCWDQDGLLRTLEYLEEIEQGRKAPDRRLCNREVIWEWGDKFKRASPRLNRLPGKRGRATGRAFAANLSTLCLMLGTKYLPSFKNAVLFIEYDKEESMALPSMERMLWQLRQSGVFDRVVALIVGELQYGVAQEQTRKRGIEQILSEVTAAYKFPVLYRAQFGHIFPSWSVINGERVSIEGCSVSCRPERIT